MVETVHRSELRRTRRRRVGVAVAAVGAALLVSRPAAADLSWEDRRRATPVDGIVGLSTIAGAIAVQQWWNEPWSRRRSEFVVDEAVRDAVRSDTPAAATLSDVGRALMLAYPVVDVAVVWGIRDSPDVAKQMFLLNLQGFGMALLANAVVKRVVGRQRPDARHCASTDRSRECGARNRWFSFPSGHAASVFTSAGLTCAHHLNLPIYGSRSADVGACVASTAIASVTALLRLMADRHHLTDVLAGAAIGGFFGFLVPSALAYRHPRTGTPVGATAQPLAAPPTAQFSGAF